MSELMIHQSTEVMVSNLPAALVAQLADYADKARGAFSRNTERAVASDLKVFSTWCMAAGVESCPAAPANVARFLDEMAGTRKVATLRRYASSIAHLHRAAGLESPTADNEVRLALRRIARTAADRARAEGVPVRAQAAGITDRDIGRIQATTGESLRDLRDLALVLVGRDALARREELVAARVADLTFADDGSAVLTIRKSKTDAAGEGAEQYLGHDATAALRRWLDAAGIVAGPVFQSMKKGGKVTGRALDAGEVPGIVKRLAARAGIDGEKVARVSGHSMRIGMAQDLVAAGAALPAVMQAGRWASPAMPAHYSRKQEAARGAVAQYHSRRHA